MAACGGGGNGSARQACRQIDRSIALYRQSTAASSPTKSAALAQQAEGLLREALPLAAAAATQDGTYQALMTTVAESSRVPEGHLITALVDQCGAAQASNGAEPPPPTVIPPPATIPAPTSNTAS